ncbi:hypothetical protein CYY_000728 [Polysphondylium violaceum]|uniref:Ribosomal protein S15 n=1 Tax=Polysphondylium violaceum TaxID=133409 RepID=A0A8J4Q364_9MYCE|nr:hypothetical protein CYY_000728 [Polysphondylium violaceum]
MLRLFQRSLIVSKDLSRSTSNTAFKYYTTTNNDSKVNKREFNKYKAEKRLMNSLFEEEDITKLPSTNQKIDTEFISEQLGLGEKKNALNINDFLSGDIKNKPGYENFDMTTEESRYALEQLEQILRAPNGRLVVQNLIADLKQTFGLETDSSMEAKLKELNKDMSLKLGSDIEAFLKQHADNISALDNKQKDIVKEYYEKHPYLRHIRQTTFILDLVALSDQYKLSDGDTFEENVKKRFSIRSTPENEGVDQFAQQKPLEEINYIRDGSDNQFVTNTTQDVFEDNIIEVIRSGALSLYFQNLVDNAKEAALPASYQLEQLKQQQLLANELDIADRMTLRDQKELDQQEEQDQDQQEDPEKYLEADVIPELDLMLPVEQQQQAKDPRDLLKYYHIYPRQIRKWIDYSHTPLGLFTSYGVWYNLPEWYSKHFQPTPPENFINPQGNSNIFKQTELPEDLQNVYRFGVTEEEAKLLHPKLKEFLSFRNASQPEVNSYRKQLCIQKYGKNSFDTGSPSVQIAVFTERINTIIAHLAKNKKDFPTKRKLGMLESKRRNMIEYLKKKDVEEYYKVTKDLKIKNYNF